MAYNHNDQPTLHCQLERASWKNQLIAQIESAKPPKVLAIHGTWGSGKTSMLAQIYLHFGGDPERFQDFEQNDKNDKAKGKQNKDFHPIWFEAWQYQHEENILAALLNEIREQLSPMQKVWNASKKKTKAALLATLQSIDLTMEQFGMTFGLKAFTKNFRAERQKIRQKRLEGPSHAKHLKEMLSEAIRQLLKIKSRRAKSQKALIIIDDLDRCEPETAFRILEAIKIYLDLPNCIFLLGMDVKAMDQILVKHYAKLLSENENNEQLKNLSRLYLEKICQDVLHLPLPGSQTRVAFFLSLLRQNNTATSEEKEIFTKIESILSGEAENAHSLLPPFPRSIKMYANILLLHLEKEEILTYLKEHQDKTRATQRLLIITYLYTFHYELYQLCYSYPDFYNGHFFSHCKDPKKHEETHGKHPVFSALILPEQPTDLGEAMGGKQSQEVRNRLLTNAYPHANLRQVLWIRALVVNTGRFIEGEIEKLKL